MSGNDTTGVKGLTDRVREEADFRDATALKNFGTPGSSAILLHNKL